MDELADAFKHIKGTGHEGEGVELEGDALMKVFKRLDSNGDGKISYDEFVAATSS